MNQDYSKLYNYVFSQKMWDKVRKYAIILARDKNKKKESLCQYIADETTSSLMRKFARNWDTYKFKYDFADNFIFISTKMMLISEFKKIQESKKESKWQDRGTIQLGKEYDGFELEIEDKGVGLLKDKMDYETSIIDQLNLVEEVLMKSDYITKRDIDIFIDYYKNNLKYEDIASKYKIAKGTVGATLTKIRKRIKYDVTGSSI